MNAQLGSSGVRGLVDAPMLRRVTLLHLAEVGLDAPDIVLQRVWPWESLCALTALRELRLRGNRFGDRGAAALARHIGALVQLRALNVAGCNIFRAVALQRAVLRLPRLKRLARDNGSFWESPFVTSAEAKKRGITLVGQYDI